MMAMWQGWNGSVSAPTMASTATASCMRLPERMSGSQYWARLMDSAPPATAVSASPSMMACAAEMMACSPLPHSRFTVSPGVPAGRPPLMAATRPRYMSLASVWITWPNTAWPPSAGSTSARVTASRTTAAARSHGGTVARPPPYLPIPVRTADRTRTSGCLCVSFITAPSHDSWLQYPLASGVPCGAAFPRRSSLAPQSRRHRAPPVRSLVAASHVQAAVDGPDLPGDVGRLIGRQEGDHAGDLVRPAEPADRDLAADPVNDLLRDRSEHVGRDVAGGHGVDGQPDPVADRPLRTAEMEEGLPGQRLRQAEHAGLGRRVVGLPDVPGLADDRGHVDDPPGAALDHVLHCRLGHEEGAGQVDGDDPLPVLVGHLRHGPVDRDARVIDEDVEPAMLVDDLLQHPAAVIGRTDIALVQGDPAARVFRGHDFEELLGGLLVAPVPGGDGGALLGQALADGRPDAAGPPGHQDHPVAELACCFLLLFHGVCHRASSRWGCGRGRSWSSLRMKDGGPGYESHACGVVGVPSWPIIYSYHQGSTKRNSTWADSRKL